MSLSDYFPAKEVVAFQGGQFEVRGLTLDDLAILLRDHLTDLDAVISIIGSDIKHETGVALMAQHGVKLIREAPGVAAMAIAIACDEPDAVDNARKLTMPVQLRALEAIYRLSFDEEDGPKKVLSGLMSLLSGTANLKKTDTRT